MVSGVVVVGAVDMVRLCLGWEGGEGRWGLGAEESGRAHAGGMVDFRARLDWSGRKRVGKIEITRSRKAKMRRCENGVVSWVGAFKIHASEEKPLGDGDTR